MLKKYFLWGSLSALLLAGCGHSERTPAASIPAAAGPESAPPVMASQPGAEAPAPASAGTSAETTRLLALLDGPRRRHDTTLASAMPDEPAEAPAPDSARTAALRRYLQAGLPAAQVFAVQPGRDTLLVGAQGTQLLLRADAWDLPAGAPVVQLAMQEFYTPADMVLAGLSTTSGPQLLETGGMLKLTATSQVRPVRLRPGGRLYLRMPAKEAQPGMQLYEGVAQGAAQRLDWQLPPQAQAAAPANPAAWAAGVTRRGRRRQSPPARASRRDSLAVARPTSNWPQYPDFEKALRAQWQQHDPRISGQLRRDRDLTRPARQSLNRLSEVYHQRIVRQVRLRFLVDSTGTLRNVEALPSSDAALAPTAIRALRQLGQWTPATVPFFIKTELNDEPIAAQGLLSLDFSKSGTLHSSLSWALPHASRPRALQLRHQLDTLLASLDFRRRYHRVADSLAAVRRAKHSLATAQWGRLRTQFTDTSRAIITEQGVYNELSAQGFSWINCDRTLAPGPPVMYRVRDKRGDAVVTLLFKRFNSVLQGWEDGAQFVRFGYVPGGQPATVVALRREKGVTYLATEPVVLSRTTLTSLRYRPVSMAELRAALNSL